MRKKRQDVATIAPVARSSAMKSVLGILKVVAAKDVALTLIGESGTGKEVLARYAHDLSSRAHGPFVPINCAAIPEALLESELFGYERGAFTGASARTTGKVAAAEGGTLFLDEIGELTLPLQAKLLRFVENLRYMRIGGRTKIDADVRLMFATSRPLGEEVAAGRFRADLYYRIQGLTISVPPLRSRREDIGPLIEASLRQFTARHSVRAPQLRRDVRARLLAYDWPGNVRELKNLVESLCLIREGRTVRIIDLPSSIRPLSDATPDRAPSPETTTLSVNLDDDLNTITRQVIQSVLALEGGNKSRAAERLRISTRTLQRLVASGLVTQIRA